jgi:hypothetical protein
MTNMLTALQLEKLNFREEEDKVIKRFWMMKIILIKIN